MVVVSAVSDDPVVVVVLLDVVVVGGITMPACTCERSVPISPTHALPAHDVWSTSRWKTIAFGSHT